MSPTISSLIRTLRGVFVGTLVLQAGIVLLCLVLSHVNTGAGFLQYRLPRIVFWIYVWVGLGAHGASLLTLVILWVKRRMLWEGIRPQEAVVLRHLIVLSALNSVAVVAWFALGGLVFFGAGGSR